MLESLLLAAVGGVIGFGLAGLAVRWCDANLQDIGRPSWMAFTIDFRVIGFLAVICAGTAFLFGLAPALYVSKTNVQDVLKEGGRGASASPRPADGRARWSSPN